MLTDMGNLQPTCIVGPPYSVPYVPQHLRIVTA
jgi:hypothetical protein